MKAYEMQIAKILDATDDYTERELVRMSITKRKEILAALCGGKKAS